MKRYLGALVLGAVGIAILLELGFWQVRRLAWKEGLLADLQAKIHAAAVAVPEAPDPEANNYLSVSATGTIGTPELHILDSVRSVGPVWRIVAPFSFDGRTVLLDRGYVRDGDQDAPHPGGEETVAGNLNWPDDRSGATPQNDALKNLWYARDIDQMAKVLGTEPLLIVASTDTGGGVTPLPVSTEGIPNDHLQYAITWFSLAAVWAGMTGLLLWRIHRRTG